MHRTNLRRFAALLLMTSSLVPAGASADDFFIDTTVTTQNGGNRLDGNDRIFVRTGGGINVSATPNIAALFATGSRNFIDVRGFLRTSGSASGILAFDANSINLGTGGSIISFGDFADAVNIGRFNTLTIAPGFTISANGIDAWGINAGSFNSITHQGSINTSGRLSRGIDVADGNTVMIGASGSVTTQGRRADGISGRDHNFITHLGSVRTSGNRSDGIDVFDGNTVIVGPGGSIFTLGRDAYGIYAGSFNAITHQGLINTSGRRGRGIDVADGNTIMIGSGGSIITEGRDADGINAGDHNTIIVGPGRVLTIGPRSNAIETGNFNTMTTHGTLTTHGRNTNVIKAYDFNTIENFGDIFAYGTNGDGIDIRNGNTVTNSGRIIVRGGPNGSGARAGAIDARNNNTITNSGFLLSEYGDAIDFSGSNNRLNLLAPSFFGGPIVLGTDTTVNIVTGRSHSVLWDFSNGTMVGGMPNISGPVPYVWNATTKQFATIDPSGFAAAGDAAASLAGRLGVLVQRRLSGAGGSSRGGFSPLAYDDVNAPDGGFDTLESAAPQRSIWVDVFGGRGKYGATGIFNQYRNDQYGIAAGADRTVHQDLRIGVMAGYVGARNRVNSAWGITSQNVDSQGLFAGVYGRRAGSRFDIDFALIGGWQRHKSTRFINNNLAPLGVDNATASYNGLFLSPEVTIGDDFAISGGWTLRPSATARYTMQRLGGYSETGSAANVSVASRTTHVAEGRLELAAAYRHDYGIVTGRAGVIGRTGMGSDTSSVTLLGSTVSVAGNRGTTYTAGFVGADAQFAIDDRWEVNLSGEMQFGQENSKVYTGRISAIARF